MKRAKFGIFEIATGRCVDSWYYSEGMAWTACVGWNSSNVGGADAYEVRVM